MFSEQLARSSSFGVLVSVCLEHVSVPEVTSAFFEEAKPASFSPKSVVKWERLVSFYQWRQTSPLTNL